jgi:hypothetical protein
MNSLHIKTTIDHDPDEPPCLRTHLIVDNQPVVALVRHTLGISFHDLLASAKASGEYFIITCACGDAGCAGISEGVRVTHHPTNVQWVVRNHGPTKVYYFAREQYQAAIQQGFAQFTRMLKQHPQLEVVPQGNRYLVDGL